MTFLAVNPLAITPALAASATNMNYLSRALNPADVLAMPDPNVSHFCQVSGEDGSGNPLLASYAPGHFRIFGLPLSTSQKANLLTHNDGLFRQLNNLLQVSVAGRGVDQLKPLLLALCDAWDDADGYQKKYLDEIDIAIHDILSSPAAYAGLDDMRALLRWVRRLPSQSHTYETQLIVYSALLCVLDDRDDFLDMAEEAEDLYELIMELVPDEWK